MQTIISDSSNLAEEPRSLAEIEGASPAQDPELVIQQGGQDIEAAGNDLGRLAAGEVMDADIDTARQRLRDCQGALVSLGYPIGEHDDVAGSVSGVMDAGTVAAVRQFQDDNDLDATGIIDRDTYEAILNGFEQALSLRAQSQMDDDFMPMHAGEATQAQAASTIDRAASSSELDGGQELGDAESGLASLEDGLDDNALSDGLEDL